jgi:hypothetical protein
MTGTVRGRPLFRPTTVSVATPPVRSPDTKGLTRSWSSGRAAANGSCHNSCEKPSADEARVNNPGVVSCDIHPTRTSANAHVNSATGPQGTDHNVNFGRRVHGAQEAWDGAPGLLLPSADLGVELRRISGPAMSEAWRRGRDEGKEPTARQLAAATGASIHVVRKALPRFRSGLVPPGRTPGLESKTVRNVTTCCCTRR